jgi:hypothetical protein
MPHWGAISIPKIKREQLNEIQTKNVNNFLVFLVHLSGKI